MMSTRGKEKDLEKGLSTPERTPKDQTRTVARPRNYEDLSRDGCVGCGIRTKKSKTSRKGKEAAGVSGQVEADGANPTVVLPIQTDGTNVGTGLPLAQINPTEVRVDGAGRQLEQELEPAVCAGRLGVQGLQDQGESSNAGHHDG
ncbi:hypothetical protein Bca52824_023497 [Brassica carinata]|uniref:Uncharacterized protein n=1 Tax=Brassica carinata TaxID=52824 RepID=A0A8X7VJ60_BRACI|nr:hypothetical protein Bca52824_023497 [Brassica carinata]